MTPMYSAVIKKRCFECAVINMLINKFYRVVIIDSAFIKRLDKLLTICISVRLLLIGLHKHVRDLVLHIMCLGRSQEYIQLLAVFVKQLLERLKFQA